jgi:hypothetical protein
MRGSVRRLALFALLFLLPAGGYGAFAATAHAASTPAASATTCVEPNPPPPGMAFGLFLTGKSSTVVALAWPKPFECLSRYELFEGGRLVTTTTDTFVRVTGLTPATTYTFTVRAIDLNGRVRAVSPPLRVTTLPG